MAYTYHKISDSQLIIKERRGKDYKYFIIKKNLMNSIRISFLLLTVLCNYYYNLVWIVKTHHT